MGGPRRSVVPPGHATAFPSPIFWTTELRSFLIRTVHGPAPALPLRRGAHSGASDQALSYESRDDLRVQSLNHVRSARRKASARSYLEESLGIANNGVSARYVSALGMRAMGCTACAGVDLTRVARMARWLSVASSTIRSRIIGPGDCWSDFADPRRSHYW
jgi:hypothetical protein